MSLFITFEGTEGAGKSTQISLVKKYLIELGLPVEVVREPGGTEIGDRIRQILLDLKSREMRMRTEILLYAASRAQLVDEVILPSLQGGKIVLCDRYIDSSITYQGYGAKWSLEEVISINQIATGGLQPDRTYLLDMPIKYGQERIQLRGEGKDRMEQKGESFHQRVYKGYHQLAEEQKRIKLVPASQLIDQVFTEIMEDLNHLLEHNGYLLEK